MFPLGRIHDLLEKRRQEQMFRQLSVREGMTDLSSNDYLGLSRSAWLRQSVAQKLSQEPYARTGATGSRLLHGHSEQFEQLEQKLAGFHRAQAALLFNSGFDANAGLLATVARPGDTIYFDEYVHASLHQGMRLSGAETVAFRHNDLADLTAKLRGNPGFIVTESLFSMEGDKAPLKELAELARKNDLALIVDEAHALGVYGEEGAGLCREAGVEDACFARVYTFGKALGSHGAVVIGPAELKNYLINYCKPFIYSTALDAVSLFRIEAGYDLLQLNYSKRINLNNIIKYFNKKSRSGSARYAIRGEGPIFGLIWPGNEACRNLAAFLQARGLDVRPILSPTVPKGSERLRISLHSFNSTRDIDMLFKYLNEFTS